MNYKILFFALSLICNFAFCAQRTLTIGATPTPHAEILEFTKPLFEQKGWKLEVREFSDYILPNIALNEKELDANFYQHRPFLDDFNKNKGTKLIGLDSIILVPMAIYSNTIKDLHTLSQNATIAIPNDPTNESRALDLLAKAGFITFKNKNSLKTPLDIQDNPKNLRFIELKAAQLPRALKDANLAIITTNYALGAGLNPLKDGIFIEDKDSLYAIIIAVREGDEANEKTKAIQEILKSDAVKEFVQQKYQGSVIPAF
ncbi:MetQ/NlpA family ABC transporter substrate-binding protein [Campylobacter sp. MIT 21-1685]|uniref:MetQ/NlpA family ABC transporter substrate-binding protein n=1 Tax=unclassified Campylobacter TaxID=2593542 RepID=UPI00224B1510|nr:MULTISPECIES: MetQ/NlpA family ABC transporter substrate-binding protein [unclassified Campylobacter]MCX2683003.1 MetQ/NlpA family ABC transporter substrate-binding protein [Campylobacter sp. MIT 21-1684]MCX2751285.1 MetQ/NlpA family ABC transporter substrate-binding protein [Campylobacter sp. MIT 21-1682]MCX2807484.1 MetQ/NlpA family ABC transporter substrate-binding protein [Campylobacter sp. MIT 21-1685]